MPTEEELIKQVTHIECMSCRSMRAIEDTDFALFDPKTFEEIVHMSVVCCMDPYPTGVIVSEDPLFPPDDKESWVNTDYWHYGNGRYEYRLSDDFIELLDEQEES